MTTISELRRRCKAASAAGAILALGAALILSPLLFPFMGCSKGGKKKQSGPPGGMTVPVLVSTAVRKDMPVILGAIGSVEAANTVMVRARVGGELTRVAFEEGAPVKKGDLLFTLDSRPFENAYASALADSIRDTARSNGAAADAQRYADLLPKDFVTKQQFDAAKAAAEALAATVASDQAALKNARLNLSFCTIRAPISGRTGKLTVRQGNLISPNGEPLVTIQQIVPCYVSFSFPEQRLSVIRKHSESGRLRVEAVVSGDTSQVHVGELSFIDNAIDETTGTILLKATFANQDETLWPGQFVDVSLFLTTLRNAVVIPDQAVQKSQKGNFVYVIKPDQTAVMQPVTVGLTLDNEVVISNGLQDGDRVVTDGQLRVTPGAKVDIRSGLQSGGPAGDGAPKK